MLPFISPLFWNQDVGTPWLRQRTALERGLLIGRALAPSDKASRASRVTSTGIKTGKGRLNCRLWSRDHGPGWLLEAVVLVLLPVSSGYGLVHAGALGEDGVQYPLPAEVTSQRANVLTTAVALLTAASYNVKVVEYIIIDWSCVVDCV